MTPTKAKRLAIKAMQRQTKKLAPQANAYRFHKMRFGQRAAEQSDDLQAAIDAIERELQAVNSPTRLLIAPVSQTRGMKGLLTPKAALKKHPDLFRALLQEMQALVENETKQPKLID